MGPVGGHPDSALVHIGFSGIHFGIAGAVGTGNHKVGLPILVKIQEYLVECTVEGQSLSKAWGSRAGCNVHSETCWGLKVLYQLSYSEMSLLKGQPTQLGSFIS